MLVSVIIPTYKPGKYIDNCLQSIGLQTIDAKKFEVIIVLNGCDEPWHSQVETLIAKYLSEHNVSLIQTEILGVSNARNIALDLSKGDYVAFIDDDDYISPRYLEELLEYSSPQCIALTDSLYFDEDTGKFDYGNIHHREYLKLHENQNPSLYQVRRFLNGPVMKLIHKDIIGKRRFDKRFSNGEDSLFMALISDKIQKCHFCQPDAIYYRRIRLDSATTRKRSLFNRILNSYKAIIQYLKYWIQRPSDYNIMFMISRIVAQFKNILV